MGAIRVGRLLTAQRSFSSYHPLVREAAKRLGSHHRPARTTSGTLKKNKTNGNCHLAEGIFFFFGRASKKTKKKKMTSLSQVKWGHLSLPCEICTKRKWKQARCENPVCDRPVFNQELGTWDRMKLCPTHSKEIVCDGFLPWGTPRVLCPSCEENGFFIDFSSRSIQKRAPYDPWNEC